MQHQFCGDYHILSHIFQGFAYIFQQESDHIQNEAGFGRINKPKYCWCKKGIRPCVSCHHIRQYRYVYEGVELVTGEGFFRIMTCCDSVCMNVFLQQLSTQYHNDHILLCCDGALGISQRR